ncbi:chitinase-3-like protein 2 [Anopheles cruzii]|uniref:chitinase-3-like protein 2 n=1 Tax=Anopheles cruzii TaxID=68878 RepID=UPI0022EC5E9F|nr:chitinase-3-like protein 2 [Anopheles cruzii]
MQVGRKMSKQQGKYELLKEDSNLRRRHTYIQGCLLVALCGMSSVTVYATWSMIYRQNLIIPPTLIDIFPHWRNRIALYEANLRQTIQQLNTQQDMSSEKGLNAAPGQELHGNSRLIGDDARNSYVSSGAMSAANTTGSGGYRSHATGDPLQARIKQLDNERVLPSRFGNFIYSQEATSGQPASPKIVCYYTTPELRHPELRHQLNPERIDPFLCTHLHIGVISIENCTLMIDDNVRTAFNRTKALKRANPDLKILTWVGGGSVGGFTEMVENHANRKRFIQSLKATLEHYHLDGVDLDWEFPDSGGKRRMHFSQLLHEIRREYQREHRTYILSVAVAAQGTLAYMAYDVGEINSYADYVNLMSYDFHFYSPDLPQTGLNAPLYRRPNERSLLGTLNINESVNYWLSAGLDRSKVIVGLPTYGHTFTLVNPFNTRIGAPASGYGRVGTLGYASYSEVCWFLRHNIYVMQTYDEESCSPYLHAGTEWISYDDERSLECKANFVRSNGFGGAMIFSLNTDDFGSYCAKNALYVDAESGEGRSESFPLVRKVRSVLEGAQGTASQPNQRDSSVR